MMSPRDLYSFCGGISSGETPKIFQFKAFEGSFQVKLGQGVVLCDVIDGPKCMYS